MVIYHDNAVKVASKKCDKQMTFSIVCVMLSSVS
jgi:hypothetical protein